MAAEKKNRTPWTREDEIKLMKLLEKGETFKDIIEELKEPRTENALRIRALLLAKKEINQSGESTEEVLDKYGLDINEYKKSLIDAEKQAQKVQARKESSTKSVKKLLEELTREVDQLRVRILVLENKGKKSSKK